MRVAAIDCGTNSIRLLVADLHRTADGVELTDVHREMRVVRLGEVVDATGQLTTGALDRTWRALADYSAILRASGAVAVRMAATSATRDAANRDDFVAMVRQTLGQDPEVLSGNEEADLSFRGAVADLAGRRTPMLVVDIGGGSTELVVGTERGVTGRVSVDIGCVRLTERVLHGDPPSGEEIARARAWLQPEFAAALTGLGPAEPQTFVAVSGTSTTVAAAALKLSSYDPQRIHLSTLSFPAVQRACGSLLAATRAHRAALPYMHPGRVDVIGAGSLILSCLLELLVDGTAEREVTVSEHDILDGLALSLG